MDGHFAVRSVVLHQMPFVDESGASGPPVICDVKPMVVIEDSRDLVSLWLPAGTPTKLSLPVPRDRPKPWLPGEWEMVDSTWSRWNAVFLMRPADWHATWVWWSPDWQFLGWYVNLQEPFVRTDDGFHVRDLQLDIVVAADRSWRWKDVDDLQRSVDLGVISQPIADRARVEAAGMIGRIGRGEPPFTDDWAAWRPDPTWPNPSMPANHLGGRQVPWSPTSATPS
jgi:hypothetical protein